MSKQFPKMIYRGEAQLIVDDHDALSAALADGWRTMDQLNALDRDGDGKPGGSKAQAKPGDLTDREINADLEALGIEPDPTEHKSKRLAKRNATRNCGCHCTACVALPPAMPVAYGHWRASMGTNCPIRQNCWCCCNAHWRKHRGCRCKPRRQSCCRGGPTRPFMYGLGIARLRRYNRRLTAPFRRLGNTGKPPWSRFD